MAQQQPPSGGTSLNDLAAELRIQIYKDALPELAMEPETRMDRFINCPWKLPRPDSAVYTTLSSLQKVSRQVKDDTTEFSEYFFETTWELYRKWQDLETAPGTMRDAKFCLVNSTWRGGAGQKRSPARTSSFLCFLLSLPGWLEKGPDEVRKLKRWTQEYDMTASEISGSREDNFEGPPPYSRLSLPSLPGAPRVTLFRRPIWEGVEACWVVEGYLRDLQWGRDLERLDTLTGIVAQCQYKDLLYEIEFEDMDYGEVMGSIASGDDEGLVERLGSGHGDLLRRLAAEHVEGGDESEDD